MKWLKEQNVVVKHTLFCMESTGIYGMELVNFINGKANYFLESPLHIKRSLGLTRGKSDKIFAQRRTGAKQGSIQDHAQFKKFNQRTRTIG